VRQIQEKQHQIRESERSLALLKQQRTVSEADHLKNMKEMKDMTRDLVKELVTFKAEAKQHIKRTLMDH